MGRRRRSLARLSQEISHNTRSRLSTSQTVLTLSSPPHPCGSMEISRLTSVKEPRNYRLGARLANKHRLIVSFIGLTTKRGSKTFLFISLAFVPIVFS